MKVHLKLGGKAKVFHSRADCSFLIAKPGRGGRVGRSRPVPRAWAEMGGRRECSYCYPVAQACPGTEVMA